nr:argininosuccinate lyase [Sphingomonas sp. Y57]
MIRAPGWGLLALAIALPAIAAVARGETLADGSRIGRIAVPKAPEFQALYDYDRDALPLSDATFPYEVRQHRAHVVMLAERGIITLSEARAILAGLSVIDRRAATDGSLRAYLPYEKALIGEIGHVAGKMHTGRSRNDLANTVNRMFYRDQINRTIEGLLALRRALAAKAAAHLDTVMVVYTHRKEAQPITLGHYLMAIDESVAKSVDRYEQLYARMNQSPLGAAASAGTSWPLDRERTASLLGFDGLVVNTIEGTAGWDHIAEYAADNAIYMSGLSRLASEIQLWSTDEYRVIELDPAFAGTSSIMPQKKNPDSLERSRAAAAQVTGSLMAVLASLNAAEYQHSGARVAIDPRSLDAMMAATGAMTGVVRTMRPNRQRMLDYARRNYSTMTDLTDALVRDGGISFREAHEVVAHVVVAAIDAGKSADQITLTMIDRAAKAQLGRAIPLSARALRDALDPKTGVMRRAGIGGPAPASVKVMIDNAQTAIAAADHRLTERRARLADAQIRLDGAVAAIVGHR